MSNSRAGSNALREAQKLGAISDDTTVGSALVLDDNLKPAWPAPVAPDGGSDPTLPLNPSSANLFEVDADGGVRMVTANDNPNANLTIRGFAGSTAEEYNLIDAQGDTGGRFIVDAAGDLVGIAEATSPVGFNYQVRNPADNSQQARLQLSWANGGEATISVGAGNALQANATGIGFFDATPAAQPAAPVTLDDVIAALKTLGLVAT